VVFAVLYAFFCETLLGVMPGSIKRLAISFHCRSIMFDVGQPFGLEPAERLQFDPISANSAIWVLDIASVVLLIIGVVVFHFKEYRDLA
jgi:hypothetical protein